MAMQELRLIVNVANHAEPGGFFETPLSKVSRWAQFSTSVSRGNAKSPFRGVYALLKRWTGCWNAARYATKNNASLVISHDPRVSYPTALILNKLGYRGKHLAFSFNYDTLPSKRKCQLHAKGFRHIDRFTVYSNMERRLYHEAFGIPLEKIDFIYWGVGIPQIDPPELPLEAGGYVCAIGGNSRDYVTLIAAMRQLPQIRLVLVARPHNVEGIELPRNVALRTNIPLGNAMNILAFSRFMVLPLVGDQVPCGHVTLVNAMHLGKAFVTTDSEGISDYAKPEVNCKLVPARDATRMQEAIQKLWKQPDICDELGREGKKFAMSHCREECTQAYVTQSFRALCGQIYTPAEETEKAQLQSP